MGGRTRSSSDPDGQEKSSMRNRLYVTNLPDEPNVASLRAFFARAGVVSEVRIVADKDPARSRAFVTMESEAEAQQALTQLDGTVLDGQALRVSVAREETEREREKASTRRPEFEQRARITQQFRESRNMTYELDCSGTPLILRVFFRSESEPLPAFRVDARTSSAPDAACIDATAPSRLRALREIAQACQAERGVRALSAIDWNAVEQAMMTVHAV
jgi:RNA recognition motif-containing protein